MNATTVNQKNGRICALTNQKRGLFVVSFLIAAALAITFTLSLSSDMWMRTPSLREQSAMDLSVAFSSNSAKATDRIQDNSSSMHTTTSSVALKIDNSALETSSKGAATMTQCFPHNTARWLQAERIKNANEADLRPHFEILLPPQQSKSIPQFQAAMEQTLCMHGSRFFSMDATNGTSSPNTEDHDKMVKVWTTRAVYLATVFHQHYHAWDEFNHRAQNTTEHCQSAWQKFRMSEVDYECPKAKFLVIPLGDNGLGANLRLGAMAVMKAALATGRVALFLNHFNQSDHRWLQKPWTLASCSRRDYQCFFMPPSPCILTHDDYLEAHILDKTEMRTLFRQGSLIHLDDQRVAVYSPKFRPLREPPRMRERLATIGRFLIRQGLLPNAPIVHAALRRLTTQVEGKPAFEGDDELAAGLLLYVSRPRPRYLGQLHNMQTSLEKTSKNTSHSIGLPIRASDKCIAESECFSFSKYIQAAQEYWLFRWPNTTNGTTIPILITSESRDVQLQRLSWTKREAPAHWERLSFEILHNEHDVIQDTGLIRAMESDHLTADQVMLSSLSSLRAQLTHRLVLGNCCSNFHRLIQILVQGGCSSDLSAEFQCLQHHPTESFRLCCAWDKSSRCVSRRGGIFH